MTLNETTQSNSSPVMVQVGEFDASGRFTESMEILKASSLKGDLTAMSELAHRLLIGDRAPKSPKHAIYFLQEAAKGGDGRALARLAALSAAGAYVKQDWNLAIKLLGQAAVAGDLSAQGQLTCLQSSDSEPDQNWNEMARRVPLQFWLSSPGEQQLHESVRLIHDLATKPVCAWLIGRAQGKLERARVYDSVSRESQTHEMRTNSMVMFNYSNFDVVQFLLQSRMSLSSGYPMQHFEAPSVLHYDVGQQITNHFDFIDANAGDYASQIQEHGQRMITFLLYLNDDYEGGETAFPELDIVNRGKTGDGLYFINAFPDLSPDRRILHAGRPPTSGQKWVVTQFIVHKRLRP